MVSVVSNYIDETFVDNLTVDEFLDLLDKHRLGVIVIIGARINDKELNVEELIKVLK